MDLKDVLTKNNIDSVQTNQIGCIVSKDEFQRLSYNPLFNKSEYVAICIHDPNKLTHLEQHIENSFPKYIDGFNDVIEVKFWDITISSSKQSIISDDVASEIKNFILKNISKKFIIHCSAGISRSAAVGKAIEYLENSNLSSSEVDKHPRYTPNRTVFNKIIGVTK